MTQDEMTNIVKVVPEKVAEFLLPQEKELLDFIQGKETDDRISYLEGVLADVPKVQSELDSLKATKPK